MLKLINNPQAETIIFAAILAVALLFSIRRRETKEIFPASLTAELKGLAILMIVISHIGYFLFADHRFLWPLSIAAGVGVNLFLFLSGFGLTASSIQKDLTIRQFYGRRLSKLFLPFWLSLAAFLLLDTLVLKINYTWSFIGQAVVGVFTHADLYSDLNSPLWYFSFILGYYLIFPLLFSKKYPWLSAAALYAVGYLVVYLQPVQLDYVMHLYKVHIIAFPLGVLAAWLITKVKPGTLGRLSQGWRAVGYYAVLVILLAIFVYANIDSGIGQSASQEQWMSIIAVLAVAGVFMLKKAEFRLLYWFGLYSYEIYLWHWPIMYRYDFLYPWLPAWLATSVYLVFFLGLGWAAAQVTNKLLGRVSLKPSSGA